MHHVGFCCQTLPPIRSSAGHDEVLRMETERGRRSTGDVEYWVCPPPPKPFLLHLGVPARTHPITDFQNNFPDLHHHFFIDRSLSLSVSLSLLAWVCVNVDSSIGIPFEISETDNIFPHNILAEK